nr:MAG TPA: hypothetical protein [Caudoviricetes sp.]
MPGGAGLPGLRKSPTRFPPSFFPYRTNERVKYGHLTYNVVFLMCRRKSHERRHGLWRDPRR